MSRLRKTLLGLALVATAIATVWDLPEPAALEPAEALTGVRAVSAPAPSLAPIHDAVSTPLVGRELFTANPVNLFAQRSWLPPAPPPAKPPAPQAPPLPFKYLGKMIEGDKILAFVGQGPMTHLLHKGSVVMGYKVEEISETDMLLVYQPLNEKQRLTFGSSN